MNGLSAPPNLKSRKRGSLSHIVTGRHAKCEQMMENGNVRLITHELLIVQ